MAEEDEQTFVGGSPNSEGVSNAELALVAETLKRAADGALVIVGLHAPLSIRGAMTAFFTTEVWTAHGLVTYYTLFIIDLASPASADHGIRRIPMKPSWCRPRAPPRMQTTDVCAARAS